MILFAHGARDQQWSKTLDALRVRIDAALPQIRVSVAFLEFQAPTLADCIDEAVRSGAKRIQVMPVFWASGGHVSNDLPPLLARVRTAHPGVTIELLPVLSELPGMLDFIAEYIVGRSDLLKTHS